MKALELKLPPVLLTAVTGLLMWLTANALPNLDRVHAWQTQLALLLACGGLIFAVYAVLACRRAGTSLDPLKPDESSTLITNSVFRVTRNPMYFGMLLVLLGWSIELGNVMATAWLFIYVLYMNQFQILPEERALEARFGDEYRDYHKRVRRWI